MQNWSKLVFVLIFCNSMILLIITGEKKNTTLSFLRDRVVPGRQVPLPDQLCPEEWQHGILLWLRWSVSRLSDCAYKGSRGFAGRATESDEEFLCGRTRTRATLTGEHTEQHYKCPHIYSQHTVLRVRFYIYCILQILWFSWNSSN